MLSQLRFGLASQQGARSVPLRWIAALIWAASFADANAQNCPDPPIVAITSSQVPSDVCIAAGGDPNPIRFFDDFSWRSFIAMVWPAESGQRGVADTAQKVGTTNRPLVFETYKAEWELFQPNGNAPSSWSTFGAVPTFPCQSQIPNPGFNDLVLAALSKFEDLGEAGFGRLVGPIVSQNGNYLRYLTSFNQTEFNQIIEGKWYLRNNLPESGLTFANGALDLKTSWVVMDNIPHPERFYTRQAWVMDIDSGACSRKTVGLVGMHIVQKTPSRPQWIWSTFEHVDNVPPQSPGNTGPFTLNDSSGTHMPGKNPISFPPPVQAPPPFNIERVRSIDSSTQQTNAAYRQALQGTVWANYELVMTQWPLQANSPNVPASPPNTFPGSSIPFQGGFANTTMETFDQKSVATGCMACHNLAMRKTDLLWSLEINAFPQQMSVLVPRGPAARLNTLSATPSSPALQQLKALMESAAAQ